MYYTIKYIKNKERSINMTKIKNFIKNYKAHIILALVFIISVVSIYIQDKDRKETLNINSKELSSVDGKICVYISGQVKKEGIYFLDKNSRVANVIDIAGGLTEDADISKINPAQKLNDSDKIIVTKKKENIEDSENVQDTQEVSSDISEIKSNKKININTATKEELMTLNGVGEATANKIINYRKSKPFKEIEDLMNVPGIVNSKFNNIKDDIST